METYKGELSYDEYRKCVDSCVAVKVGRRTTVQQTEQSQRRYSSALRKSLFYFLYLIVVISSFEVGSFLLFLLTASLKPEKLFDSHFKSLFEALFVVVSDTIGLDYTVASVLIHVGYYFYCVSFSLFFKRFCPVETFSRPLGYFETLCCFEEIDYGSGFIIGDKMVVTCMHVIEEALKDKPAQIHILNDIIGELPCEVVHWDAANDLALLYCHDLDLQQHGISPLDLSEKELWPSIQVFTFGFPITHTGKSALYADGKVSGCKERFGRKDFMVLNGFFNNGNSGGPVFCRIDDAVKVVGVVAQKHKKELLTLEENIIFAEEEQSSQNVSIKGHWNHLWKVVLFKIHDALNGSHCQFGYCNAVPGYLLVKFVNSAKKKLK